MSGASYQELKSRLESARIPLLSRTSRQLRRGVREGDPASLTLMGECLTWGRHGYPRFPRRGVSMILRAAEAGHPQACEFAADLYRTGTCRIARDETRARALLALPADLGSPSAAGWLAWFEWFGIGGPVSKEAAFIHARTAVAGGDLNGYRIGALIQAQGFGVQQDTLLAITILRELLLRVPDDSFGLRELGRLLYDPAHEYVGQICPTQNSREEGERLLRQAAALGDAEALKLVTMSAHA